MRSLSHAPFAAGLRRNARMIASGALLWPWFVCGPVLKYPGVVDDRVPRGIEHSAENTECACPSLQNYRFSPMAPCADPSDREFLRRQEHMTRRKLRRLGGAGKA